MSYNQVKRKEEKQFIQNMIFLREERKWTQQQTVNLIGMGLKLDLFKAWEQFRSFPPLTFCRRISIVFGIPLDEMSTEQLHRKAG